MNSISAVAESNGHAPAVLPSRERPWPTGRRTVDRVAVQRAARDLLVALGADPETEGLRETPRRMAAAYAELLTPEPFSLTTFPNGCKSGSPPRSQAACTRSCSQRGSAS
jgi:hypothetical protein